MEVSSVIAKNMPEPLFWFYLPQHFLLNVFTIIWYAVRGRGRVILKAKWDAIKACPGCGGSAKRYRRAGWSARGRSGG